MLCDHLRPSNAEFTTDGIGGGGWMVEGGREEGRGVSIVYYEVHVKGWVTRETVEKCCMLVS